jgi:hypothetical protein
MTTVKDLYNTVYKNLKNFGIYDFYSETDYIMSKILNINKVDYYTYPEKKVCDKHINKITKILSKRFLRQPLPYILNEAEFYGFKFKLSKNVLIPRQETEIIVESAITEIKKNNYEHCADIGLGCGNIAISITKLTNIKKMFAADVDKKVLQIAKKNAKVLGVDKKIKVDGKKVTNPNAQFMDVIGSSVGFGKRLKWPDDYFQIYTSANYNYYHLNKYSLFQGLNTGFANDFHLSFNISRNSVDAPIFPKNGSNISLTGQWTPPYSFFIFKNKNISDLTPQEKYKFIEYQKYKFTAEWFTQITNKKAPEGKEARNLVLRLKMGWGFLAYYQKAMGFSPFERFYLGGSGLSGFQNFVSREIIALRGYPDNSLSESFGSPIVTRYTMELRYPLTLNPQATIFVLGFAEAGNAFSQLKYFNPFSVKRSAGIGIRIFLPMFGLLGLDYGWGFDAVPGNPGIGNGKGQFHFTIGGFLGEL